MVPSSIATACRMNSWRSSSGMDSSGAANGITSTPCILSFARNFWNLRAGDNKTSLSHVGSYPTYFVAVINFEQIQPEDMRKSYAASWQRSENSVCSAITKKCDLTGELNFVLAVVYIAGSAAPGVGTRA